MFTSWQKFLTTGVSFGVLSFVLGCNNGSNSSDEAPVAIAPVEEHLAPPIADGEILVKEVTRADGKKGSLVEKDGEYSIRFSDGTYLAVVKDVDGSFVPKRETVYFGSTNCDPTTAYVRRNAKSDGEMVMSHGSKNPIKTENDPETNITPMALKGPDGECRVLHSLQSLGHVSGGKNAAPQAFEHTENLLYLAVDNAETGRELLRSDGTAEGTFLLKDIEVGTGDGLPKDYNGTSQVRKFHKAANGKIYFVGNWNGAEGKGNDIYVTDGSKEGTKYFFNVAVNHILAPQILGDWNDHLYVNLQHYIEGTGTSINDLRWHWPLVQLNMKATNLPIQNTNEESERNADFSFHVFTRWAYEGGPHFQIYNLLEHDGKVYGATMVSEGASSETKAVSMKNFSFGPGKMQTTMTYLSDYDSPETNWNTDSYGYRLDRVPEYDITFENGKVARTGGAAADGWFEVVATDFRSTPVALSDAVDSTDSGTEVKPKILLKSGSNAYFLAPKNGEDIGDELWRTDGTKAGTMFLKDILPGPSSSDINEMISLGDGRVLFSANDGTHGYELWISDGTTAGTKMIKDINPGDQHSFPSAMAWSGGLLYFAAESKEYGREAWVSDLTDSGTKIIADIGPGPDLSTNPDSFYALGTGVLFVADHPTYGKELFFYNGTRISIILDAVPGIEDGNPKHFYTFKDEVYLGINWGSDLGHLVKLVPGNTGFSLEQGIPEAYFKASFEEIESTIKADQKF